MRYHRGQASVKRHIALDSIDPAAGGTGGDGDSSAWGRLRAAFKFTAVRAKRGPLMRTSETGKEVLEAAATDLLGGNATKAEDDLEHPPTHAFLGPNGAVAGYVCLADRTRDAWQSCAAAVVKAAGGKSRRGR